MYPSQTADKLMLRLPEGLRQKVKIEAAMNNRSMNAEVIYHLQRAYEGAQNEKSGTTA
jgi:plasmid stability protein